MALIRCPDCGRDISTDARACPGCGRPSTNGPPPVAVTPPIVPPVISQPPAVKDPSLSIHHARNAGSLPVDSQYSRTTGLFAGIEDGVAGLAKQVKQHKWLAIGILVFGVLVALRSLDTPNSFIAPVSSPTSTPNDDGLSNLMLTGTKWYKAGFDSIMKATFQIYNHNEFAVKDITVRCTYFANSGTQIDSNTKTIYEVVPAKSAKSISDFSMGFINSQVASASCKAISVKKVY
jgi:hypothetical protein